MDRPIAPKKENLPPRRNITRLEGGECTEIKIRIQTITPVLGGGVTARELDRIDIIRVPTIRGHLRFWWRALYGHQFGDNFEELYRKESELWGGAGKEGAVKSRVEISVTSCRSTGEVDDSPLITKDINTSYALWPAREEKRKKVPAAKLRNVNSSFDLRLVFSPVDKDTDTQIRNALRAWILFGGYGSRTRRGVGSLTVQKEMNREWLPPAVTPEDIKTLFDGDDILAPASSGSTHMPSMRGAALIVGKETDQLSAWKEALGWLRAFRQGTKGEAGNCARNPDPQKGNRPSTSNWPEPDKIRQLSRPKRGTTWAHQPRYNSDPAWPRASFGLPIGVKFQDISRKDGKKWQDLDPPQDEPGKFELRWKPADPDSDAGSRLASPLIVKALPLADGKFVPCALWLNRDYPDGMVVLEKKEGDDGAYTRVHGSEARFGKIAGLKAGSESEDEKIYFEPLVGKATVKEAFLTWLAGRPGCVEVVR